MTLAESRREEILREGSEFLSRVATGLDLLAERSREAGPVERRRLGWEADHLVELYRLWSGGRPDGGNADFSNLQSQEAHGIV